MNTKKLTIVWLQQTISDIQTSRDNGSVSWDDERENILKAFEIALAAMGSEPVYQVLNSGGWRDVNAVVFGRLKKEGLTVRILHTEQPAPEREQVRREHAEWSQATFGDVGPIGPLKHLSKEALEAAADPHDPLEWADMQFLLWDAQRRMGISDEFITRAMIEKLAINKARQWPEPKDGEPRMHFKQESDNDPNPAD